MARPPPDCIWRMKNTHTAISSSMGNQDTRTLKIDGTSSSAGRAEIFTPFLFRRSTRPGSSGAKLVKVRLLSENLPEMRWPWITTSEMFPGIDLGQQFRVADLITPPALRRVLEQVEQREQQETNDHPDREVPEMYVHEDPFLVERSRNTAHSPGPSATGRRVRSTNARLT